MLRGVKHRTGSGCLSLYVFGKTGVQERFCSVPGSDLTKIIDFNQEMEIPLTDQADKYLC